jgi:cation:H+ antiporter
MLTAVLQFVLCAAFIVVAGTFLTRYADAIADLTGFGRLLVGSILLAGATSLPELTVDISAVRLGNTDLAVGDLMGSSLFNLLILAMLDLMKRSSGRMFSRAAVAHALSGTASILLAALAGAAILLSKRLSGISVGPVGPGTIVIIVAYAFCIRMIFHDQRVSAQHAANADHDVLVPAGSLKLWQASLGFAIAALVIVVTGPFLASAADELAELTGLGGTFVGTTLVALCTSLPELVASFTAVKMGAFDLAVGNVFGSNAFNMVLLFPLDIVHATPVLSSVSTNHAITALATVIVTSVALMGQLYQVEKRIRFIEPDALLVILLVIATLAGLYYLR